MTNTIFTYKQIPKSLVEVHWNLNDLDITIERNEVIKEVPGWQKNDDIGIGLDIYLNIDELYKYIRPDRSASIYVTYHSKSDKGGTSLHGLISKIPITKNKKEINISDKIDGTKIAGLLEITVSICIDSITESNHSDKIDPFLATEIGSILYTENKSLILEGDASFFPVADIDFSKSDLPSNALYFLQRSHKDLDIDFSTAYRLYFNNHHPKYTLLNEMQDSEAKEILLDMIIYDIYKELIMNALDDETFEMPDEDDPEKHTVRFVYARLLNNILKHYYSNESLSGLRKKAHSDDPKTHNYFISALQDFFLTLGGK